MVVIYLEEEGVDVILRKNDNLISCSHPVMKAVDWNSHSQLALNQEEWLEGVLTVLKIPVALAALKKLVTARLPWTMIALEGAVA